MTARYIEVAGMLGRMRNTLLNLLPDSWMIVKGSEPGTIHLTYDDGPDPDVTPQLLALLKERNAKATFFLVGKRAKRYPELVRQLLEEGHTLGNHSYNHKAFHTLPVATQMNEIRDTNRLLQELTGQPCRMFRAPAGRLSAPLFLKLLSERITYAYWSRDSLDYTLDEAEVVENLKQRPIQDRDIVLLHDDHRKVVGITEHILTHYRDYRFTAM